LVLTLKGRLPLISNLLFIDYAKLLVGIKNTHASKRVETLDIELLHMQTLEKKCCVGTLQACGDLWKMRDRIEAVSHLFLNHSRDKKDISMI